jgi:hypothetical protein
MLLTNAAEEMTVIRLRLLAYSTGRTCPYEEVKLHATHEQQ